MIEQLLSAYHTSTDSQRVMFLSEILRERPDGLTPKEQRILRELNTEAHELNMKVLKVRHHLWKTLRKRGLT